MIEALHQLVDSIKARFEATDKNILDVVTTFKDALFARDAHIMSLQRTVNELEKKVADLQSTSVDKILLEGDNGNQK